MPPNNQPVVHRVEQALAWGPEGVDTLLVGKLNAHLAQPRYQQEGDLATAIVNHGLSYQSLHFIPRQRYRGEGGWSWRMWREGKHISVRGD